MIIGTITLITMLFFGQEYFLVDKLEKGVKKYIVEKDRRKDILTDLKESKKIIKAFNKDRKSKLKLLKEMNVDRNIAKEELEKFYFDRLAEKLEFQREVIRERLKVTPKITREEWDNIMSMSAETVAAQKEKADKKKSKDIFSDVINKINQSIEEKERASKAVSVVSDFKVKYNALVEKRKSMNALESEVLQKKDASFKELENMAKEGNVFRKEAFSAFLEFHFTLKDLTSETEWKKIMKEFNKLIS